MTKKSEWITLCGFVFPFIALSTSHYKLPHYVFPLFPFVAVITADFLVRFANRLPRWLEYFQLSLMHLFFVAGLLIFLWAFPVHIIWFTFLFIISYALFWWFRKKSEDALDRWILPILVSVIFFQMIMSLHFYPNILKYQSSTTAGKYIATEKPSHVYWYDTYGYDLDYYSGFNIPNLSKPALDTLSDGSWVYVSENSIGEMPPYKLIQSFEDFRVSQLNLGFVNPKTRSTKVKKNYLLEITKK